LLSPNIANKMVLRNTRSGGHAGKQTKGMQACNQARQAGRQAEGRQARWKAGKQKNTAGQATFLLDDKGYLDLNHARVVNHP
jgi:hypothetical protein